MSYIGCFLKTETFCVFCLSNKEKSFFFFFFSYIQNKKEKKTMLLQNQTTDPISIVLNLMFFILIFISMFYGTKIQAFRSQKVIQDSLENLKKLNEDTKKLVVKKFREFVSKDLTIKDIEVKIDDLLNFVMIQPVDLDPSGIIKKLDHLIDVRESWYYNEVKEFATEATDVQIHNLENVLEIAMALNQIYRLILHFLLLGKKTKSYILLVQTEMQLGMVNSMAKAYASAAKAFAEGSPIGDSLGPLVAATFIREISQQDSVPYSKIAYETIVQVGEFEGRKIYIIRAKGPGGSVGKPGEAIKNLVEEHGSKIKSIIMIDAGLKLEGDKTGSVVPGIGAAIGGIGVEKSKIEDYSTERKIPVDSIICRQSLEDAINTMKKSIINSVPVIIDKIKASIRKRSKENDIVIVAGIGNTIGIGV